AKGGLCASCATAETRASTPVSATAKSHGSPRAEPPVSLANAGRTQCRRGIFLGRGLDTELHPVLLFVDHPVYPVTARNQVIKGLDCVPGGLCVVLVQVHGLTDAPQLSAPVIGFGSDDGPGVLVDIETALGIDVALAFLQVALDHPDAVQLITRKVLIGMPGLENIGVLHAG